MISHYVLRLNNLIFILTKNLREISLILITLLLIVNTNSKAQVGEPYFVKNFCPISV